MSEEIIYVDLSEIRDGKLDELKRRMRELVHLVEENEPQLIAYNVYFNKDRSRMTVIHVHSDAASLERHMDVAGRMFPRFADLIRLESIDIYGAPDDDLVDRLRSKARMLGSGNVHVHELHAGIAQFAGA